MESVENKFAHTPFNSNLTASRVFRKTKILEKGTKVEVWIDNKFSFYGTVAGTQDYSTFGRTRKGVRYKKYNYLYYIDNEDDGSFWEVPRRNVKKR